MERVKSGLAELGQLALLTMEVIVSVARYGVAGREWVGQLYQVGVKSQLVVVVTGAFTGMVLCAQTYYQFHTVGMDTATLAVVSVAMCSELGPVLTGLMVAGRVGAAMAAELGTMKVTEQIDALRALATHPVDYLVVPRVGATLAAMPLLAAESVSLGIVAGYGVGVGLLGIDGAYAWHNMIHYTGAVDVVMGLLKAVVFGFLIAVISCHKGMACGHGAEGVGRATTQAVVHASISILVANFFLTLVLAQLLGK